MRRKKAKVINWYSGSALVGSSLKGYEMVNIPRFKHKKKPISMIKALEVRDKMNRKKIFYNSETWEEKRKKHLPKNTVLLSEVGGGSIGKMVATNLETGESKIINGLLATDT